MQTWTSTHKTKLKKVQIKQKHALRIIFNSAYLSKIIHCIMSCLSHQFLLNKLLSTTNIPKNYTFCNISWRPTSLEQLPLKKRKRN